MGFLDSFLLVALFLFGIPVAWGLRWVLEKITGISLLGRLPILVVLVAIFFGILLSLRLHRDHVLHEPIDGDLGARVKARLGRHEDHSGATASLSTSAYPQDWELWHAPRSTEATAIVRKKPLRAPASRTLTKHCHSPLPESAGSGAPDGIVDFPP